MFHEDTFKGKVALITGAGHPLANSLAQRAASLGARVALIHDPADADAANAVEMPEGTLRLVCDGTEAAAVKAVVRTITTELGGIDVLICGSADIADMPLAKLPLDDWQRVIGARLTATMNFNREMIRPMMRTRSGRIVNVLYGASGAAAAIASRGIWAMTRSLALEVAPYGIYINCVSIGQLQETEAFTRSTNPDATPLGRLGRAEEAAQSALFLASDLARTTNGLMMHGAGGATYE
jgi:NAD(P)-dependent dehydrogenase (short-subunit alcohol dehydrogenase family)